MGAKASSSMSACRDRLRCLLVLLTRTMDLIDMQKEGMDRTKGNPEYPKKRTLGTGTFRCCLKRV